MSTTPVRRPRGRLRSRIVALGAAALLLAAAGCSALGGSDAEPEGVEPAPGGLEKPSLRFGILPIVDVAALPRAQNAGYFAEEGLTVELVVVPSGAAAIPQLVNGELDMAFVNWPSLLLAQSQEIEDFRIVYPGYAAASNSFAILTRPDSTVKTPQDLAGKRIAVNTRGSINEVLALSAMQTNGVDASGVQWVDMPFPEMIPAMQNDQIDAAIMVEPFQTAASRNLGAVTVLDITSGPTADIPIAGGAATAEFVAQNPNTVAAFQRAVAKAQADMADRAVVEETLPTYTQIDAPTAALLNLGVWPTTLDTTRLQRMADLMREFGVLTEPVDVAPLLEPLS